MPTISANGGAERYWRRADGSRLVLCANGRLLRRAPDTRWWLDAGDLVIDATWQPDTSPRASASVTRTGRLSRRGS